MQYENKVYSDNFPSNIPEAVFVLNPNSPPESATMKRTLGQIFLSDNIFEVPMTGLQSSNPNEQLWPDRLVDLDARNLIDMQVAITDPGAKRIRGACFTEQDRQQVKTACRKLIEERLVPFIKHRI